MAVGVVIPTYGKRRLGLVGNENRLVGEGEKIVGGGSKVAWSDLDTIWLSGTIGTKLVRFLSVVCFFHINLAGSLQ